MARPSTAPSLTDPAVQPDPEGVGEAGTAPALGVEPDVGEPPTANPREVGYCRNADCPQQGVAVPLWRPVGEVPVLCQCGHLLHDEPHDPPAESDDETDA